ncbi:hypothetical protein QYF36_012901 [Acer negundo]|nr:hypothetical protein QYF36_012901 [Acer negundo]
MYNSMKRMEVQLANIIEAKQNQVHEDVLSQPDVTYEEVEKEETDKKVNEAEDVPFEASLLYKELKPYVPPITFPSKLEQEDVATFSLKGEEVEKEETGEKV